MPDAVDVVCVGETLVDFLPMEPGRRVADVKGWIPCTGGSPANVAVGVARLGLRSAVVGVVGEDEFGIFLRHSLRAEGVEIGHLRQTSLGKTGLVFVSLTADGERSFSFFRTQSAETFLGEVDVAPALLSKTRVLHVGTNSLIRTEAQEALKAMVGLGVRAGKIISCDPNLRLHYWPDPGVLRGVLDAVLPSCTVVKLSDEEVAFVTGAGSTEDALRGLGERGVALPIITHGERGASLGWKGRVIRVPGVSARQVVDTTGAGDGFVSAFLTLVAENFPDAESFLGAEAEQIERMAQFACACASRVVEKLGAVSGLPRREDVDSLWPVNLCG